MFSEQFQSFIDREPKYIARHVLWNPKDNVVAVRIRPESNYFVKDWFYGRNLVTNDGDIYYAKKGAGETPAANENFLTGRFEMRNLADTPAKVDTYTNVAGPITASRKTYTVGYPKTNDTGDADNTGDAVDAVSYLTTWVGADFNDAAIQGGCIHDNAAPVAATKLLCHWSMTSFAKGSTDGLKVFVNHAAEGV